MHDFDDKEIIEIIKNTKPPDLPEIEQIVTKAFNLQSLDLHEIDKLLKTVGTEELFNYVIKSADELKRKIFGNKIKIYIPVYITNECVNNCLYCGFRRDNKSLHRKTLSLEEFKDEMDAVLGMGHRTIELVLGQHPHLEASELAKYVGYAATELRKKGEGSVILMSAPLKTDEYKILKKAGLNEVYCWQETYDRTQYEKVHPVGTPKHDYSFRTGIFERVLQAGIEKYGMGILFGLYNWEYDVLALLRHAKWLQSMYGIAPSAFGVPRFKKAEGAVRQKEYYNVTDEMYGLAVAVYRLTFPYAQTYLNTRENIEFIIELLNSGGSEVNIEASTYPGGYCIEKRKNGQFFYYSYDSKNIFNTFREMGFEPYF